MKNVAISGYIGFGNFGDEAIFCALSSHLKDLNHNICAICNNPDKVKKEYNVSTCYFKSFFGIIKTLFKCDILISGGGSLLQNKTSNHSLFYYLFIILLAKLMQKKVIIFSQGFEPIKGEIPLFITKEILKKADFISVRDKNSYDLLSKYNIKSYLTSDPVYSLLENVNPCENKNGIIIQLRKTDNLNKNFISDLAYAISNIEGNISVFSFQDEYDREICEQFINELSKYKINANLITNKNIYETINIINNSKYIISTRLHGLIAAHALKTKCFGIVYDDKIKTLCDELKIDNIDIHNYSKNELKEKLVNFFSNNCINVNYRKYDWEILDNFLKSIQGETV